MFLSQSNCYFCWTLSYIMFMFSICHSSNCFTLRTWFLVERFTFGSSESLKESVHCNDSFSGQALLTLKPPHDRKIVSAGDYTPPEQHMRLKSEFKTLNTYS